MANAGGLPQPAAPGTNGLGDLIASALEMSNVDLANEFSHLITTQRAFQASARIVTTSDEVLQEVVNLKR
jgi:flagellar hook protein FlgE